jgi:DNA-binding LacI/PurR family transcriptional regulator
MTVKWNGGGMAKKSPVDGDNLIMSDKRRKSPTIYDVAALAGVSHQTVARYLRGDTTVRTANAEKMDAALATLNYRPNPVAKQLRMRKTNRVGVLIDQITQSGPARILSGALEAARAAGYVLDIVIADDHDAEATASALEFLASNRVAGIVALAQTDVIISELRRASASVPVVVDALPGVMPSVGELVGTLVADHLAELGHTRVGYVGGPMVEFSAIGRAKGFVNRTRDRGGEVVWTRQGDWSAASGLAAWESLDPDQRDVTAIACGNDSMAIGLISAAMRSGVGVPSDLSVIGTDDLPDAQYLNPPLTTVAMDFEAEGRHLMAQLLSKVDDKLPPPQGELPLPRLVARESTRRQ